MSSEQWLKLDAYTLGKPFIIQILDRYGWAGFGVWIAYLAACKQATIQGRLSFMSDVQALQAMGIYGRPLVDNEGQPFTLEDFFTFTGRMKQTRRTAHGHVQNVICTHWERWQNAQKTDDARQRKRRSRATIERDTNVTRARQIEIEKEREIEKESDDVTASASLRAAATSNGNYKPEPPDYPEWTTSPNDPNVKIMDASVVRDMLSKLRQAAEDATQP